MNLNMNIQYLRSQANGASITINIITCLTVTVMFSYVDSYLDMFPLVPVSLLCLVSVSLVSDYVLFVSMVTNHPVKVKVI